MYRTKNKEKPQINPQSTIPHKADQHLIGLCLAWKPNMLHAMDNDGWIEGDVQSYDLLTMGWASGPVVSTDTGVYIARQGGSSPCFKVGPMRS